MTISNATILSAGPYAACVSSSGNLTIGSGCKIHSNQYYAVQVSDTAKSHVNTSGLSTGSDKYYAYGYPNHYQIGY